MAKQMAKVQKEEHRTRSELLREAWRHYFKSRYPLYTPTKAERAAINKGRAEFKRGEYVSLANFTMNWQLLVTKSAGKELKNLPGKDQLRVENVLDALQRDAFSGDIIRLQPSGWRRRIGNYRIFYDLLLEDHLIVVTAIKRRTSTTY